MLKTNLFKDLVYHKVPDMEPVETLVDSDQVRIERIVSVGHTTPEGFWYDQSEDEWVVLLGGEAEITFDNGEVIPMEAGDALMIEAGCRHRVTATSTHPPAVWLAVFISKTSI
ncbi:MAG: cupin domain-containing protein [Bacteroidales bacterium]